jgi:sugar phosphate isomerase/epimerase
MPYTAQDWPITAALLQFPGVDAHGVAASDADAEVWRGVFQEIADAGFKDVDLTDSWVRPGDLSPARLEEFKATAAEVGVGLPVISVIRQSVIHETDWQQNLDYSHRSLEAGAALGCEVVSFGLHQAITPEQQRQLWFWTVPGHQDPVGDKETWAKAVSRLQELGRHAAELGLLVSLEMYEDTYVGTADSAVRLVEDIAMPNVGLNPDVGNLIRLHRPIEPWLEVFAKTLPYSNYWHVKNYIRDEDPARDLYVAMPAPMESGLINYRQVFAMALENGFQGILCMEHYGGDGLSVSAANQEYLRTRVLPKTADYKLGTSRVAQGRQTPAATRSGQA